MNLQNRNFLNIIRTLTPTCHRVLLTRESVLERRDDTGIIFGKVIDPSHRIPRSFLLTSLDLQTYFF